jgi:molybdopterin-guanine dinucleotide biosynthesis protein A
MGFSGAVLTGGRSSRFGTDKAFVEVGGTPMVLTAHRALSAAGAEEIAVVGGDARRLAALGLATIPDSAPHEGPLGAIVDVLAWASTPIVVVLACDQPEVGATLVQRVVDALRPGADAAVPVVDGVPQPLCAAYARDARDRLRALFVAGERSPRRALGSLRWSAVDDLDPRWLRDVDDPDDLARYAADRCVGPADEGEHSSG